jgi:mannosylglycerate hydrolase
MEAGQRLPQVVDGDPVELLNPNTKKRSFLAMKISLITHTHWDREWYRTYQEFRIFLVRLLDDFLDYLEVNETYHSFLLDGQTVQLEDYLEVRPDEEKRIRQAVRSGKLIIGPMYVQPDEYTPSGEALVRNFLVGKHVSDRFGPSMQIGYFPDSFGHCSQMPQILKGFGINTVVLWRGLCDEDTEKTELLWESKDGSQVLVVWMPYSYGNAHVMGMLGEGIADLLHTVIATLGPMATTGSILLMKGWDHSGFTPEAPGIIEEARKHLPEGTEIVHSNLETFVADIREAEPKLEVLQGEFRKPKTMRIHAGITTTRMDIKQANRRAQNRLEKRTEPICSLAWITGRRYPQALLNQAWKYILQSQAHDSLCCCCTDEVLRSTKGRFISADEISDAIYRQESMAFVDEIQTDLQPGQPFTIVNTYPQIRDEIAQAELLVPYESFVIVDREGQDVPYQVEKREVVYLGLDPSVALSQKTVERTEGEILEAVGQRPDDPAIYYNQSSYVPLSGRAEGIEAYQVSLLFPIRNAPALGYESFYLQAGETEAEVVTDLICTLDSMENQYLKVEFSPDGSFSLLDKETDRTYSNLHIFEDQGDAGDSYNYSPPLRDITITSQDQPAEITPLLKGPFCASFRIRINLSIPKGLSSDGETRSEAQTELQIESEIRLYARAKRVEIHSIVENEADDHRLRVLFPTGISTTTSFAEEQFGVIQRPNHTPQQDYWERDGWVENPLPIYPQQTFVDLTDGEVGLAVLNRDLTEYEIVGDDFSIIAVTLLRSVGAMGRPNLVIRPGRASGLEVATPDGLCHGVHEYNYAVFPHSGDYSVVGEQAALFNAPLHALQADRRRGTLPPAYSFMELGPAGLVMTCLKRAEWGEALILRIYNSTSARIDDATLRLGSEFKDMTVVDLKEDEIAGSTLERDDALWILPPVNPNQILTLKLSLK